MKESVLNLKEKHNNTTLDFQLSNFSHVLLIYLTDPLNMIVDNSVYYYQAIWLNLVVYKFSTASFYKHVWPWSTYEYAVVVVDIVVLSKSPPLTKWVLFFETHCVWRRIILLLALTSFCSSLRTCFLCQSEYSEP